MCKTERLSASERREKKGFIITTVRAGVFAFEGGGHKHMEYFNIEIQGGVRRDTGVISVKAASWCWSWKSSKLPG